MTDKKFSSTKQFLKRNRKHLKFLKKAPTALLAKMATGELDVVRLSTIVLAGRMQLRVTSQGDTKVKATG